MTLFDPKFTALTIDDFGAIGDYSQKEDFSIVGNRLSSPSVVFVSSDIGKVGALAYAGKDQEHLVFKIVGIDTKANEAVLDIPAVTDVSNKLGCYTSDSTRAIQDAVNHAVKYNSNVVVPAGNYCICDIDEAMSYINIDRRLFTEPNKSYGLVGQGRSSIITEFDGKTQRNGRYSKMFYHWMRGHENVGSILIKDLTFDKNGRSLTKQNNSDFFYEQAHCFAINGNENLVEKVERFEMQNVHFHDKIGAGFNWSSSPTVLKSGHIEGVTESTPAYTFVDDTAVILGQWNASTNTPDIFSTTPKDNSRYIVVEAGVQNGITYAVGDHAIRTNGSFYRVSKGRFTNRHGVLYGERGDIEMSPYCDNIVIQNVNVRFVQIEPVASSPATKELRRNTKVMDSIIGNLQYTEPATSNYFYSDLYVCNCQLNEFLARNVNFVVTESTIKIPKVISTPKGVIQDSIILVDVDTGNKVRPIVSANLTGYVTTNNITFKNLDVRINSEDPTISPVGAVFTSNPLLLGTSCFTNLMNVNFDPRFRANVFAYRNGTWLIQECNFSGDDTIVHAGGFASFASSVTLINNNYDNVRVGATLYQINNHNALWNVSIRDSFPDQKYKIRKKGAVGDFAKLYTSNIIKTIDTIENRSDSVEVGDIFEIENPVPGGFTKYICTKAGNSRSSVVKGYDPMEKQEP